jgi:hypothetical protein
MANSLVYALVLNLPSLNVLIYALVLNDPTKLECLEAMSVGA